MVAKLSSAQLKANSPILNQQGNHNKKTKKQSCNTNSFKQKNVKNRYAASIKQGYKANSNKTPQLLAKKSFSNTSKPLYQTKLPVSKQENLTPNSANLVVAIPNQESGLRFDTPDTLAKLLDYTNQGDQTMVSVMLYLVHPSKLNPLEDTVKLQRLEQALKIANENGNEDISQLINDKLSSFEHAKAAKLQASEELLNAVVDNDLTAAADAIKTGADINGTPELEDFDIPLTLAAEDGNLEMMSLLLESGADVDKKNTYGNTPLLAATKANKFEAVQLLIKHNANISYCDLLKKDALAIAQENNHNDIKLLLETKISGEPVEEINSESFKSADVVPTEETGVKIIQAANPKDLAIDVVAATHETAVTTQIHQEPVSTQITLPKINIPTINDEKLDQLGEYILTNNYQAVINLVESGIEFNDASLQNVINFALEQTNVHEITNFLLETAPNLVKSVTAASDQENIIPSKAIHQMSDPIASGKILAKGKRAERISKTYALLKKVIEKKDVSDNNDATFVENILQNVSNLTDEEANKLKKAEVKADKKGLQLIKVLIESKRHYESHKIETQLPIKKTPALTNTVQRPVVENDAKQNALEAINKLEDNQARTLYKNMFDLINSEYSHNNKERMERLVKFIINPHDTEVDCIKHLATLAEFNHLNYAAQLLRETLDSILQGKKHSLFEVQLKQFYNAANKGDFETVKKMVDKFEQYNLTMDHSQILGYLKNAANLAKSQGHMQVHDDLLALMPKYQLTTGLVKTLNINPSPLVHFTKSIISVQS